MRRKLIASLFLLQAFIFPQLSLAATFSFLPNQGNLTTQTTTSVDIKLSSNDSVNVASAVISYPVDLLDIAWIRTDTSAFGVEVEQSINNGQIRISRGALTPVSGPNIELATIGITPKTAGNAAVSFADSSAAISASDASNILNLASSTGANFSISTPQATTNPTSLSTINPATINSSPTPTPNITDTACQQSVNVLKTKLLTKYKSVSKVFIRLDTISALTANYYQTQLTAKGHLLPGYSIFNEQSKTARQASLVQLSSLQNVVNNLSCANAKKQTEDFKNTIVALKKDLTDYKQANTNLLTRLQGL